MKKNISILFLLLFPNFFVKSAAASLERSRLTPAQEEYMELSLRFIKKAISENYACTLELRSGEDTENGRASANIDSAASSLALLPDDCLFAIALFLPYKWRNFCYIRPENILMPLESFALSFKRAGAAVAIAKDEVKSKEAECDMDVRSQLDQMLDELGYL